MRFAQALDGWRRLAVFDSAPLDVVLLLLLALMPMLFPLLTLMLMLLLLTKLTRDFRHCTH